MTRRPILRIPNERSPWVSIGVSRSMQWDDLRRRVHGEFVEMPGLSLTVAQAARLFHLPETSCLSVLGDLVDSGLLRVRPDGRYALTTEAA